MDTTNVWYAAVRYDSARKSVTVIYQGRKHVLADSYGTHDEAMVAGYAYARSQGWQPSR